MFRPPFYLDGATILVLTKGTYTPFSGRKIENWVHISMVYACLLAEQGGVRDFKGRQKEGSWAPAGHTADCPNSNACIGL